MNAKLMGLSHNKPFSYRTVVAPPPRTFAESVLTPSFTKRLRTSYTTLDPKEKHVAPANALLVFRDSEGKLRVLDQDNLLVGKDGFLRDLPERLRTSKHMKELAPLSPLELNVPHLFVRSNPVYDLVDVTKHLIAVKAAYRAIQQIGRAHV
jgi:hypothetical protein